MADGATYPRFGIQIQGEDRIVSCEKTQKVLTALEAEFPDPAERPVRVGCRQGGCGACRVKVLSGDYNTDKMSRDHVSIQEEAEGFALACRLYPLSDLEIEPAFVSPRARRQKQQSENQG